jgi:hypothetical protein
MHQLHTQTAQDGDGRPCPSVGSVIELDSLQRARARREESELRCVSSGYLSDGCSCHSSVPATVVDAAWKREIAYGGSAEDRFFHFACEGEVWLAFGLADGSIRGVYCPTHRAERDARAGGEQPLYAVCELHDTQVA